MFNMTNGGRAQGAAFFVRAKKKNALLKAYADCPGEAGLAVVLRFKAGYLGNLK